MMRSLCWRFLTLKMVTFAMLAITDTLSSPVSAAQRAETFHLDNGMQVVVIPDHRAPVVTHMVWYRVGAADEKAGQSGIAHFLEHLMFKATETMASGEFSKAVARMGGQDNAFTGQDVTAYFQRISKDRLAEVMRMEADRMTNLKLDDKEVLTERNVVLEERRSRVENDPNSILAEQMNATLYLSHPYNTPIIGWMHEVSQLTRKHAMDFYKNFYAPNNAILVVAGDVTSAEVMQLARETYGKIARNPEIRPYNSRPLEPKAVAARRLELKDSRAGNPLLQRYYLAPSYNTAQPGEAEALDLLFKVIGQGTTSRLYKTLVKEQQIATNAGAWYSGSGRDYGKIGFYGIPASGNTLPDLEAAIDGLIYDVIVNGITSKELERAKRVYLADHIYQSDSQSSLARRYGFSLVIGQTIEDIEAWPDRIARVTLQDISEAAKQHLDIRKSVTGYLTPDVPDTLAN
ncbi:MAG: pitrilysin family protein [Pseudomonadota bacterium]